MNTTVILDSNFTVGSTPDLMKDFVKDRQYRFESYTQRCILASIFVFIFVVGTIGNSLVILAVLFSRKLRTFTNVFVVNLSVADLLICISLSMNIVALLSTDGFPLPDVICAAAAFVAFTGVGCSVYTLAVIALSRWAVITRSISTQRSWFTVKKLVAMVIFTWLVPAVIAFLPPFLGLGQLGYAEKYSTCSHKTSHDLSDFYSLLQGVLFYPVPLVIIIVCYYKVFTFVRLHSKNIVEQPDVSSTSVPTNQNYLQSRNQHAQKERLSRRQIEITKNLFYVVLAFLICITPFGVSLMIPPSDPAIPWTSTLLLFNSCVNPVIYATKHPNFKKIFRQIVTCRWADIPEPSRILKFIRCSTY
ncbi:Melatonin receptor type 1A [Holothuria leucospilota]|uniref:Melatonin receptor type 1A n=1 Tax=Holothuria leucospilota TaxID=206669 RepID=A0A9Q1BGR5_HOLLE|nr:Melatonin receptor type 1A [Holothuria leucospilota]